MRYGKHMAGAVTAAMVVAGSLGAAVAADTDSAGNPAPAPQVERHGTGNAAASRQAAAARHAPAVHPARATEHGRQSVAAAQRALNKSGARLKVDGVAGPATETAILNYQEAHRLKPTGHLDQSTEKSLGIG